MSFWVSSRTLFLGATAAGGAIAGGFAIYNAIKKDNEATKQMLQDGREFWNKKIDELEQVLVGLKAKGGNEANGLIQKIVTDFTKNKFFDLNNDGKGFQQEGKSDNQRITLATFCKDSSRKSEIDPDIAKRICEKGV